ncbi:MAG TPA: hypothetical protein VK249_06195 [Anaerolineales bacterium]|nr:hypothetical protein [Anaerolineales bacterium]
MDPVIYSASPFQVFIWSFVIVVVLSILGISGIGTGIFRRKEKPLLRVARGCSGVLLIIVGIALAFVAFRSLTGGSQTIATHLNDKRVAVANCNNGDTCTHYVLETQAGSTFYDLDVTKATYEKAQVNSCYSVTYYPGNGLFGKPDEVASYQSLSNITRIESVACR